MLSISLRDTTKRLTDSIRTSLSRPPRRLIQGATETTELPGSSSRILWVLSRYFLRQKVFEQLKDWRSPSASPRSRCLCVSGRRMRQQGSRPIGPAINATVYAWDAATVEAAIVAAGLTPVQCTICPETFMREPLQNGVRLATMIDGLEGQVWREGSLAATRWWPTPPPIREWVVFPQGSRVDLSHTLSTPPAPSDAPLLNAPWTSAAAPITDFWSLIRNDHCPRHRRSGPGRAISRLFGEVSVLGIAETRLFGAMLGDLAKQTDQSAWNGVMRSRTWTPFNDS